MELPIQPTWESDCGTVKLWLGDCLKIMPSWPADAVDVVVVDPPFGVDGAILNPNSKGRRDRHNTWFQKPDWDKEINPEWCRACSRWPTCWFGNWRRRLEVESAFETPIRCEIIWAKDTHVGPPCPAAMQDERMWWFSASGLKTTRFETTIWNEPIIPTWAHRRHRNEKPEGLMIRAVSWVEGKSVADPFMGSGTTGVAAVRLGRSFWGIELDPDHFETAKRRIQDELRKVAFLEPKTVIVQPELFGPDA
jgi:DNA modification methylase